MLLNLTRSQKYLTPCFEVMPARQQPGAFRTLCLNVCTQMTRELDVHAKFRRTAEERVQTAEDTVTQLSEQLSLVAREGKRPCVGMCCGSGSAALVRATG